jgi:hypothetical protein
MIFVTAAVCIVIALYFIPAHFVLYGLSGVLPFVPPIVRRFTETTSLNLSYVWLVLLLLIVLWIVLGLTRWIMMPPTGMTEPPWPWLQKLASDRALCAFTATSSVIIALLIGANVIAIGVDAMLGTGIPAVLHLVGDVRLLVLYALVLLLAAATFARDPYARRAQALGTPMTIAPPPVMRVATQRGLHGVRLNWLNPAVGTFSDVVVVRDTVGFPQSPDDGDTVYVGDNQTVDDQGLQSRQRYYYALFARSIGGRRSREQTVDVEPLADLPGLDDLSATQDQRRAVTLGWSKPPAFDAEGMTVTIRRRLDRVPSGPGDGTLIYQGNATSCMDRSLAVGETGYYRGYVCSALGEYSIATPGEAIGKVQPAPKIENLAVEERVGEIRVTWRRPDDRYYSHVVIRRRSDTGPTDPNPEYTEETFDRLTRRWIDTDVDPGRRYTYTAVAHYRTDEQAAGSPSEWVTPKAPEPVRGLQVNRERDGIRLIWTNPRNPSPHHIVVVRSITELPRNPADGVVRRVELRENFRDLDVEAAETYYYAVFTYDAAGHFSRPMTQIAVPRLLPAVQRLRVQPQNADLRLIWENPVADDFEQVIVRRGTNQPPARPTDGDPVYAGTDTECVDPGLTAGQLYAYAVFAVYTGGFAAAPATQAYTAPAAPAGATPGAAPGAPAGQNQLGFCYWCGSPVFETNDPHGAYIECPACRMIQHQAHWDEAAQGTPNGCTRMGCAQQAPRP